jgi:sucrose phosphorylase
MMPETFEFITEFAGQAKALGIEVLVEIHSYYQRQIEIAKRVDWVYDFALPPLLLHSLYSGTSIALRKWIAVRPVNALTVLDTHDGIGIIDIGADPLNRAACPGLIESHKVDALVEQIHVRSQGQSRKATGAAASNLDLYQVNCTYFDALGGDARSYLLARVTQLFLPGIPQIYYVGLLAGANDMDLLERTGVGRDINRHYYASEEIVKSLSRPVVQDLIQLIRHRNTCQAFQGSFELLESDDHCLNMRWIYGHSHAEFFVNFATLDYKLQFNEGTSKLDFQFVSC